MKTYENHPCPSCTWWVHMPLGRWPLHKFLINHAASKQLTTLDVHELTHGVEKRGRGGSNTGTVVQCEGCLSQKQHIILKHLCKLQVVHLSTEKVGLISTSWFNNSKLVGFKVSLTFWVSHMLKPIAAICNSIKFYHIPSCSIRMFVPFYSL